jgi:hypothetical protein
LGVAAAAYGLSILWRRRADHPIARWISNPVAAAIAVALVFVAPIAQAGRLRFDINPARTFARSVGAEFDTLLPPGSYLAVADRLDNGIWAFYIRYELGRHAPVRGLSGGTVSDPEALRTVFAQAPDLSHIWVHVPEPAIEAVMGVSLMPKNSHLLARAGDRWRLIKSWPWPGYDDPHIYDK